MKNTLLFVIFSFISLNMLIAQEKRIDETLEVGTLPGSFSVNGAGAAIYTIPLELPKGRGGMTPNLAFVYNSQSGKNVMGKGWSIAGFSSISRVSPQLYYNNEIGSIDFDNDDFMLDGQRLIKVKTHSNGDIEYRTEIDGIAKIVYHPESLVGDWWQIFTKDGITKEYGLTIKSRQYFSGSSLPTDSPFKWHLSREVQSGFESIDTAKYFFKVLYSYNNNPAEGEVYPDVIKYNIVDTDSKIEDVSYSVCFDYDDYSNETKRSAYYQNGTGDSPPEYLISNGRKIDQIRIIYADQSTNPIKIYDLDYLTEQSVTKDYFLKSIQLSSRGPSTSLKMLNKTEFNWNFYSPNYGVYEMAENNQFPIANQSSVRIVAIDIDGDGRDEIAEYKATVINEDWSFKVHVQGLSQEIIVLNIGYNQVTDLVGGDFNNDGKDELIVQFANSFKIYSFEENSGVWNVSPNPYLNQSVSGPNLKIHTADINGDMLTDCIAINDDGMNVFIGSGDEDDYFINDGNGGVYESFGGSQRVASVSDFNGDGKVEVLTKYQSKNSKGTSFVLHILEWDFESHSGVFDQVYTQLGVSGEDSFYYSDFNGDGKTDVLFIANDSNYKLYPSYGEKFMQTPKTAEYSSPPGYQKPVVVDMNNDGRGDLVRFKRIGSTKIEMRIGFAKHDGIHFSFETIGQYELISSVAFDNMGLAASTFANLKGNGIPGPIFEIFNNPSKKASLPPQDYNLFLVGLSSSNQYASDVITSVTNGLGVSTQVSYQAFTSSFESDTDYTYPLCRYKSNQTLVKEKSVLNGNSTIDRKQFVFKNPVYHKQGKGFLGFINSYTIDYQNNMVNEFELSIFGESGSHYYHPYIKYVKKYLLEKSIGENQFGLRKNILHFQENRLDMKITQSGNLKVCLPIITESLINRWDANGAIIGTNKTIVKTSDVDEYGNILSKSILSSKDILTIDDTKPGYSHTTNIEKKYENLDLNNWIVNRTTQVKITKSSVDDVDDDIIISNINYYNTSNIGWPNILKSETIPNGSTSKKTTTEYEYDNYGNVIKETLVAPNIESRITNYEYSTDYNGRFLTSVCKVGPNGDIHKKSYSYYSPFGLLEQEIENPDYELNKRSTNYTYDALWNVVLIKHPDGLYQKTRIGFNNGSKDFGEKSSEILYVMHSYLYSEGNENNQDYWMDQQMVLFDKYGRTQGSWVWNPNGNAMLAYKHYDSKGRLQTEEESHFIGVSDFKQKTYSYDVIGRLEYINFPASISKYYYNGLQTTETDITNHTVKIMEKNCIGQIISVQDNSGNIVYKYYNSGNIKSINTNGAISQFEYDDANRKSILYDPNSGTVRYSHNAFGKLISQTDAKGIQTSLYYDKLGRLNRKVTKQDNIPETITYLYHDNPNLKGFGQLKKEEVRNGIYYTYSYDKLGRLLEKSENIDGVDYTHKYDYDPQTQQLDEIEYPSGFKVLYKYKTNGSLEKVTDEAGTLELWKPLNYNGRGQLTDYILGNGISTHKDFDEFGFPERILSNGGTQDLKYQFNAQTGNLSWRKSTSNGIELQESFGYDGKQLNNRLSSWQVIGQQEYNIHYMDNGNMLTKTDLTMAGDPLSVYQYGMNAGPHALTEIHNPQNEFLSESANAQETKYNRYNKIQEIKQKNLNHNDSYTYYNMAFVYGPNQMRKTTLLKKNNVQIMKKYYIDNNYEIEYKSKGNIRKLHYLSATNGIFAIYVDNLIGNDSMYYIHKDYQGNMETVTSSNGTILEKLSFDPWGRKRNPDNWTNTASTYHSYFDRGYTMHEHLPVFGIINMNGRLYDPWVGRMLSPDPHVQNPSSVQNYNRYSYALNNPLKYTDPSGYSYKPDDWDDPNSINHYAVAAWGSDGRGGVFDFSGVNSAADEYFGISNYGVYEYRDGAYYSGTRVVDYSEVFNSFVEPNSNSYSYSSSVTKYLKDNIGSISYNPNNGIYGINQLKLNIVLKNIKFHIYTKNMNGSAGGGDELRMFMKKIPDLNDDQVIALTTWSGALGGITALAYAESGPVGVFVNGVLSVPATVISIRTTADAWRDYSCIENPSNGDFVRVWSNTGLTIGSLIFWPLAIPAAIIQVQDINGNYNDYWNSFNDD